MRKLTLLVLTLFIGGIIFTNCSKKNDTTPSTPTVTANSLKVGSGSTENLTESTSTSGGYDMTGITLTGQYQLGIVFLTQPTASSTETLSSLSFSPAIVITDNSGDAWQATSGTVTVTVSGSTITVTFSNATFTAQSSNAAGTPATLTATGSLTSTSTSNTNPGSTSSKITINGSSETVTSQSVSAYGLYDVTALPSSGNYTFVIGFFSGKPTSNGSATISSSQLNPSISVSDNSGNAWTASSGTVSYTVSGSTVTITITNGVFTANSGNSTGATGSLTVNGSVIGS